MAEKEMECKWFSTHHSNILTRNYTFYPTFLVWLDEDDERWFEDHGPLSDDDEELLTHDHDEDFDQNEEM